MSEPGTIELTATEAARAIAQGRLSAEEIVAACLGRIAAREPEVGAWEHLDAGRALSAARETDAARARGIALGPLAGVPIGVKDIIDTVDMPTTLGSRLYAGRRPTWDAACVAACRRAGAIVLGKTVTTEFAFFQPGKTRNPFDTRRTPGGSSSGSAAAVADRMVPVAFGSQTAGSVIRPAAFCGVVGYKASFGEFSLSGIRPFAESLDTLGILARSIDDVALLRGVLMGLAHEDPAPPPGWAPRIGLCRTAQWALAEPSSQAAVEAAAQAFAAAGAAVADLALPPAIAGLIDAQKAVMAFEAARNYVHEREVHPDLLSEHFRALVDSGRAVSYASYRAAKAEIAEGMRTLDVLFGGFDALLVPAAIAEAPMATGGTGDPLFSRVWTALHVPNIALPAGLGPAGLPVAIQLVGRFARDADLLRVAKWAQVRLPALPHPR